jgi:hypothetical protein
LQDGPERKTSTIFSKTRVFETAFHHASIAYPLSFSLFLPLHKPYVTDMEGFMGMGFKDILVWLRSHLAEIVFLLIVLVVLLLMGY